MASVSEGPWVLCTPELHLGTSKRLGERKREKVRWVERRQGEEQGGGERMLGEALPVCRRPRSRGWGLIPGREGFLRLGRRLPSEARHPGCVRSPTPRAGLNTRPYLLGGKESEKGDLDCKTLMWVTPDPQASPNSPIRVSPPEGALLPDQTSSGPR